MSMIRFVIQRAIGYCINVRVPDWRAYLGMAMLGFTHGLNRSILLYAIYNILVKFIVSNVLYLAFTFSINNCFDIKSDMQQKEKLRKNPIAVGLISLKEGIIVSLCIASIGLVLARLWFEDIPFLLYIVLVFLSAAYSIPPLRFKSIAIIDLVSHGFGFGLFLFLYGILVAGSPSPQAIILGVSIFLCSVIFELRNHLQDLEADAISGTKNTVYWLGPNKARKLLKFLLVVHWLLLIIVLWSVGFQFALVASGIIIALFILLRPRFNDYVRMADVFSCMVYASSATSHLIHLLTV